MQTLTEQLIEKGLKDRVLTDTQLKRLIPGSSQRRYNLVYRAMKANELIRLRRGLYILPDKYRSQPCHPYVLAQRLVPGSYVSLETALAYHNWIPEAVYSTASVMPGHKAVEFNYEVLGRFTFHPLAVQAGYFLQLVDRKHISESPVLMARPIRALLDLVCLKELEWQGFDWILKGMRVDEAMLNQVTGAELRILKEVYKYKRVQEFITQLEIALGLEFSHD